MEPQASSTAGTTALAGAADAELACSVIVGLVSAREGHRIFALLDALRAQHPAVPHEVIVADRLGNHVSKRIVADYAEVRLLSFPAGTPLPSLRAAALAHARGAIVAVTVDHCLPSPGWLASIVAALADGSALVAAVGGAVRNGLTASALDRATFECEYGKFVPPVVAGPHDDLPGMNIAYVRRHLAALPAGEFDAGFWEMTVHPLLRARGFRLLSSNAMQVTHCKHFGFGEFVQQRFLYSRDFAGRRFGPGHGWRRLAAFFLTPALPALLLWRFHRLALLRASYRRDFVALLPFLVPFAMVWACGEMVGYALGPGDALARLE